MTLLAASDAVQGLPCRDRLTEGIGAIVDLVPSRPPAHLASQASRERPVAMPSGGRYDPRMPSDPPIYRRQDLYDQVWTEPLRDVARRYGISDVALGKICKKLDVPRPPRGHWAKKAVGKHGKQPPLPPLREGVPAEYRPRPGLDPWVDLGVGEEAAQLLARERTRSMVTRVANTITAPRPMIRLVCH
jgi:hypothetical protein